MPFSREESRKIEEANYTVSLEHIGATEEGGQLLDLFDITMDYLDQILIGHKPASDDELTVQTIGARLFGNSAVAFRDILSGYYQAGFILIGDMIETHFLLDYFRSFPGKIKEWKAASNEDRSKNFSPSKIYPQLDARDGFTGERRKKTYQLFCEYARHPTYPSAKLLAKGNIIQVGPFYDETKLENGLFELNKRLGLDSLALGILLRVQGNEEVEKTLAFMGAYGKFFNLPMDKFPAFKTARQLLAIQKSGIVIPK